MMNTCLRKRNQGSALVVTMLIIFGITIAVAISMQMTTAAVRQTDGSRDFAALRSAAEGALEFAYGVWVQKTNNLFAPPDQSHLTTAMATLPSFKDFPPASASEGLKITPVDEYGKALTLAAGKQVQLDNFPGWVGQNFSYLASVRLMGTLAGARNVKYGAKRTINYSVVPLFQATAFFEHDLELFRPAPMVIGGLVHTNSKAYVSSSTAGELTFTGNLSYGAVDGYLPDVDPPRANTWDDYVPNSQIPPTYANGGFDAQVHQVGRMEPLGADSASLLHPPIDADGNPTSDTNPNDDSLRELIEPPNTYVDPATQTILTRSATDPQAIKERRLFNKAGILIRITGTAAVPITTITTQNSTGLTPAQTVSLTNALSRQTIYDRREGKSVDVTSLDISRARTVLNGAAGFNNILYIDDTRSTGYDDPKAIRITEGSTLPAGGLTIASQNPVYIEGDYNTSGSRVASAVYADAVTILSNSWDDDDSDDTLSHRKASNTTVNTAIVAGFLPSGWTNSVTDVMYGYSGGLNNFPRFLEDWKNKDFKYTGSMIELFTSAIGTGEWDTGAIYAPPRRDWTFDSNFLTKPPPGSLTAVSVGRGALSRF